MKNILSTILLMLVMIPQAHAISQADTKAAEFGLNRSEPSQMVKNQLGTLVTRDKVWVSKLTYDFAVQGGATGSISLRDAQNIAAVLPKKAVVTDCIIDVLTAPTQGGTLATIALTTGQGAGDLKTAAAISGYSGLVACVPVGSAATSIKMTADQSPKIVIAGNAITAGKINILLQYMLSD